MSLVCAVPTCSHMGTHRVSQGRESRRVCEAHYREMMGLPPRERIAPPVKANDGQAPAPTAHDLQVLALQTRLRPGPFAQRLVRNAAASWKLTPAAIRRSLGRTRVNPRALLGDDYFDALDQVRSILGPRAPEVLAELRQLVGVDLAGAPDPRSWAESAVAHVAEQLGAIEAVVLMAAIAQAVGPEDA